MNSGVKKCSGENGYSFYSSYALVFCLLYAGVFCLKGIIGAQGPRGRDGPEGSKVAILMNIEWRSQR